MAGFIQNIIWNSVEGFVEAGTRSVGEYAGNALIKAGDMLENGGRGVGTSIENKATSYGSSISGQTYKPSPKPLPSTARKPVIKRSNSLPASTKPAATRAILGTNNKSSTTTRSIPPFKGPSNTGSTQQLKSNTPNANNLAKAYKSNNAYPSSGKKTAVRAGQPRPFVAPVENKKTYPGTNTLPGQGNRKAIKAKPPQRLGPQVAPGQKMQHLAI